MNKFIHNFIGISINDFDIDLATVGGDNGERGQVVRFQQSRGPLVDITAEPNGVLPISLTAARQRTSIEWLADTVRRAGSSLPHFDSTTRRLCIAVSSGADQHARDRIRDIASENGWSGARVCGHDLAVAFDRFRESTTPVTALMFQIEFDHVDISLISALKGVARIRDHRRAFTLGHRILDEVLLAGTQKTLDEEIGGNIGWYARWLDVYRIRRQLESSMVTAVELEQATWGTSGTLDVSHDDLWPALANGFDALLETAGHLLRENLGRQEKLDQILLLGGSPFSWKVARDRIGREFGVGTQVVPIHQSSAGAALVAKSEDPRLEETPRQTQNSSSDSARSVRAAQAHSTTPVRFHFEKHNTNELQPVSVEDTEFKRSLQALWTYVLGVSSVSPARSLELVQQVIQESNEFLAKLESESYASDDSHVNPHVENARNAILAGRYAEAVSESHRARELDPDDPGVFREMINFHIDAAQGSDSEEQALQWLECAHSHDQSDTTVHRLIAEFALQWAQTLGQLGRFPEALKAVDRSLVFQPFNKDAARLAAKLQQRDSS